MAAKNTSQSTVNFWIGNIGSTAIQSAVRDEPSGICIKDVDSSTAKIYYSKQVSTDYSLTIETVGLDFSSSSVSTYSIESNCANLIAVEGNIIVLSCTTSQYGHFTIYKQSDMTKYAEFIGNSSFYSLASQVIIMSHEHYHQIYYNSMNSMNSSDPDDHKGRLGLIDIFENRRNTSLYTISHKPDHDVKNNYDEYAKFMAKDSNNTLFVGNRYYLRYYRTVIEAIQVCSYTQSYSYLSCSNAPSNHITFGTQQNSTSSCDSYDESSSDNRLIAETLCNYT